MLGSRSSDCQEVAYPHNRVAQIGREVGLSPACWAFNSRAICLSFSSSWLRYLLISEVEGCLVVGVLLSLDADMSSRGALGGDSNSTGLQVFAELVSFCLTAQFWLSNFS